VTPFAKIALALDATGVSQGQNTGSEHFVGDSGSKLPASFDRIPIILAILRHCGAMTEKMT
jgi:hypothetical protein